MQKETIEEIEAGFEGPIIGHASGFFYVAKQESNSNSNIKHKFENGCMWEGGGFEIQRDVLIDEGCGDDACQHCHSIKDVEHKRWDGSSYFKKQWICPAVVVAYNEGGHNSTGVCLHCIIEAAKSVNLL